MPLHIRPAVTGDAETIVRFIRELAAYEEALHEVQATAEHIRQTLFCPEPRAFALICEDEDGAIGFAVYFFNYSTWQGQYGLYLEDLYVSPQHRGKGAGQALLQHLAQLAVARDCGRFEWSVLDWNEPAIRVYQHLGAQPQSEWVRYRLSGEALAQLAAHKQI
ncbi:GNAT superfamily N-acetyltransferase [Neisseria sp. HSC-16F19]|nr:GNAT family N-acetyltransferase [Neisseria sp. HSC-16F19]MCP2039657.1 GNAT superfamily N-acetyltransferase [Neisseria sp. HSC-16F19]